LKAFGFTFNCSLMINQRIRQWLAQTNGFAFSLYAIGTAFSVYLCMYGFRKPFEAPTYEGLSLWGLDYKILLIITQVLGYMLSKFSGIKVVAEMTPSRRVGAILVLIGIAEVALFFFGLIGYPWNWVVLFLHGLPLGLIWGIVFSFLEGRRFTEMLGAGLCASFIVGSGVVKSVGIGLIQNFGVDPFWMPFLTGLIFLPPLVFFVWLLSLLPPPSPEDVALRTERVPMNGQQRRAFFLRFALGLTTLILIFVALTAYRDLRDKFALELWTALGYGGVPSQMAKSETIIGVAVTGLIGLAIFIRHNLHAFWTSLGTLLVSGMMVGLLTYLFQQGSLDPEWWMISVGFWMYLSYVAYHVLIFERLITVFRIKSNIGYLMYLADAFGYAGSVFVLLYKNFGAGDLSWLQFFIHMSYGMAAVMAGLSVAALVYFYRKAQTRPQESPMVGEVGGVGE
jgi:hypothetical protein